MAGDYNISGYNFQWTDGVFGMSLSPICDDGYRTLYFHAMSGITEFSVSTSVLQDNTLKKGENHYNFHIVGNKGPLTQGPSSIIDSETCIDYFTQINRNGIACWDTTVKLSPKTFSEYYMKKYLLTLLVSIFTSFTTISFTIIIVLYSPSFFSSKTIEFPAYDKKFY